MLEQATRSTLKATLTEEMQLNVVLFNTNNRNRVYCDDSGELIIRNRFRRGGADDTPGTVKFSSS